MNPYNSAMIIVTIAWLIHVSHDCFLRIRPYLFCIEKFITQYKTTEIGHRTRFRRNYVLPLWRGPAIEVQHSPTR